MAWPAALTVKTLHGKIVAPDFAQTPAVGRVEFHLPFALRDSPDNVIVGPQVVTATLIAGEFTIDLPATNDPDISPSGWTYKVVVVTNIWKASFYIEIPFDAVSPLELADIAPAVTPPAVITYALAGHLHAQYIPYSLLTAKGGLIVATGPGAAAELAVGANGLQLTANSALPGGMGWAAAGAGGGGGFKGTWNPAVAYNAGESVLYRDGLYATEAGAGAGVAPVVVTDFFSGPPTLTDTTDSGDYLFRAVFNVAKRLRMIKMNWFKTALQTQTPQEMRFYNITESAINALAIVNTAGLVTPADVGTFGAPIIGDLLPGRNYAAVLQTGAGAERGYAYTPNYPYPVTVGSVQMTAGGFATGFANISGAITNPTTNYSNVAPQWEEPSTLWALIGRFDPVVVGNLKTYMSPVIPF
jgi:hypothetical protein